MQLGAVDMDAENWEGKTPWMVCQRMHKAANLKKFENVLYKGQKPANYDSKKEGQLKLRGKFARAVGGGAALTGSLPIMLVFPGQGSQYVGMMKELVDIPEVVDMLATAKTILGYDILDLMLNGPEEKLGQTKYTQPALYISALAAVEKLKQDKPEAVERCQALAGLSLGEYTALAVAGVFSFADGLALVKVRGEAMEHETTKPDAKPQAMLSVAGLERSKLIDLCKGIAVGGKVCQIANYLFPNGFSCAGDTSAIEQLEEQALKAGALQAKRLKTSGAFHTPIMAPAREKLLEALNKVKPSMNPPRCQVYMNVTSQPIDSSTSVDEIVSMLGDQLTNAVQWDQCMQNAIKDGVAEFYECGPQKQLKAMMKRINQSFVNKMTNVGA
jgi:[acyl-carrier-protein] S-malonyltransferase